MKKSAIQPGVFMSASHPAERGFARSERRLVGPAPTIAVTPVADGRIGADLITLNAMLRIPVDMHNIPGQQIFRPTIWDRFGGDDFRVCAKLGPLYR